MVTELHSLTEANVADWGCSVPDYTSRADLGMSWLMDSGGIHLTARDVDSGMEVSGAS